MKKNSNIHKSHKSDNAKRISISISPILLKKFEKSMINAGFSDRSKAIQNAIHSFVDENEWQEDQNSMGAGAIMMLYDNHKLDHDGKSIHIQHEYIDIIGASTHMHLDHNNCLETIMIKGKISRIKEFEKALAQNRGIKSLKTYYVSII